MGSLIETAALAYSDVFIQQARSHVASRREIDTSTKLANGMPPIEVPIISANMDTVTESSMAIMMARHGGIGIIHRFMTPEDQAHQVKMVKDSMKIIEDSPPTIGQSATIADVLNQDKKKHRGYVIVKHQDQWVGIATTRDFESGRSETPVSTVMTPRERVITVPIGTSLEQAVQIMRQHRIEKIPMIDQNGNIVGVYTLKDDRYIREYSSASKDNKGRLLVGAAIGVRNEDVERAHRLAQAGVDVLVLDIAHGGLDYVETMLKRLKIDEKITVPIIAGNVATVDTVKYIVDSGADGVKVGVGPGFVCTTRNVAGTGTPQVTAIFNAVEAMKHSHHTIPIIADGGIREAGDFPKAIGAGAQSIMIGSLLAGTQESPGDPIFEKGVWSKQVRGMASSSAFETRRQIGGETSDPSTFVAEGRTTTTPFKGSGVKIIYEFSGGLRSGMSYAGASTIQEMNEKCVLQVVTPAGANENKRALT